MDVAVLSEGGGGWGGHLLKRMPTIFRSHFRSFSTLGLIFQLLSVLGLIFRSRALKIQFLVRTRASKMRCLVHSG